MTLFNQENQNTYKILNPIFGNGDNDDLINFMPESADKTPLDKIRELKYFPKSKLLIYILLYPRYVAYLVASM